MMIHLLIAAAALATAPLQRSGEVLASIGVDVQLQDAKGPYTDLPRVLACLRSVGIQAVRDSAPRSPKQIRDIYLPLAKAGVKFDLFLGGEAVAPALARIAVMQRESPGSVLSIQEPDRGAGRIRFGDLSPHEERPAATAHPPGSHQVPESTPPQKIAPVQTSADHSSVSDPFTVRNVRVYPPGDQPASVALTSTIRKLGQGSDGGSSTVTEFGYSTLSAPPGVSERAQARLLLAGLLDSAARGERKAYVHELVDTSVDASGSNPEMHFGLFNRDYSPKTAARMIHMLTQLLGDPASDATSFAVKHVEVSWSGGRSDLRSLILSKSDGEIDAAFWRDVNVYDLGRGEDLSVSPYPVDVRLPVRRGRVVVSDPASALRGDVRPGASVTRLWVGADPLFIQILPKAESRAQLK